MKAFAVDVSGSQTDSLLKAIHDDILVRGHPLELVCFFSNKVLHETHVGGISDVSFTISGGGTLIDPVIKWAEQWPSVDEIIIYTDGFVFDRCSLDSTIPVKVITAGVGTTNEEAEGYVRRYMPYAEVIGHLFA